MKRALFRYLLIGIFAIAAGLHLNAQVTNSLFFMPGVPQANRVNPAIQPQCNFYLGFPGAAPLRFELASSTLAYQDIFHYDSGLDSLITFLHPNSDKQAFLNLMKPVNFVASDIGTSLFSLGFRAGGNFFSVDVTTRVDGNIYYPGDLFNLLIEGAHENQTYTLDGLAPDVSVFDEISVGWSRKILYNLDIGARAKFLFGVGDLASKYSEINVTTSQDRWTLQSDMLLNASLPFAEVKYDEEGNISDIIIDENLKKPDPSLISHYMFNFKNFGFAADLGVNYRPIENLVISASLSDLGFISWKDSIHEISYKVDNFDFEGIEVNPLTLSEDFTFGDLIDSSLTALGDSLSGFLSMKPGTSYTRMLNTKLYVGASYYVTPHINFGLLSRTDFLNDKISQQFTASANLSAGRYINFSLSYSYINTYFKNLGAGLSFNFGPLNLYLISDNALNIVFWPQEAQSANFWFGMNLVFGYKNFGGKEFKDKPMIY